MSFTLSWQPFISVRTGNSIRSVSKLFQNGINQSPSPVSQREGSKEWPFCPTVRNSGLLPMGTGKQSGEPHYRGPFYSRGYRSRRIKARFALCHKSPSAICSTGILMGLAPHTRMAARPRAPLVHYRSQHGLCHEKEKNL